MAEQYIEKGHVYILRHSIFQDIVTFGCSTNNPADIATELSSKTNMPGTFSVLWSGLCQEPCKVKQRVISIFRRTQYIDEFYKVNATTAINITKRESMRIPVKHF